MKVVEIKTPKGIYHISLEDIAEHRANYYIVEKDGLSSDSNEYKREVSWALNDDFEGIDWIINNTDWLDWEPHSTKVSDDIETVDEDFWGDSDNFNIVTL
jgi:hypothetical protein